MSATGSRRRRRGNAPDAAEDEVPTAAPAAPAVGAGSDDEGEDESPADTGRRSRRRNPPPMLQQESTRAVLRRQQRVPDDHQPTASARLYASVRTYLFGSRDHYFLSRYQVATSMPLQMMLYFNIPYAILFAIMNQMLFAWKSATWDLPLVVAVVSPMVFWVWAIVEPIRLLLGYVGNLRERVAWLGGFWVLTIFPQIVVHIYFVTAQAAAGWFVLPIEIAMSAIYLLLVLGQLVLSYSTVKRLIAKAMADFHLTPIESDDANAHL